jgi:hypothetical protein
LFGLRNGELEIGDELRRAGNVSLFRQGSALRDQP